MGFLIGVLYVLFIVSSLVLIGVILLQEGKGGGFTEAFSGIGAETFGVRASGLHKFTAAVAGIFIVAAILISVLRPSAIVLPPARPAPMAPVDDGEVPGPGEGQAPPEHDHEQTPPPGEGVPQQPDQPK